MAHAYKILGKSVQPHVLAIATLLGTFGLATYFTSGTSATSAPKKDTTSLKSANTVTGEKKDAGEEINFEKLFKDFIKDEAEVEKK